MSNSSDVEWRADTRHHVIQHASNRFPELLAQISNPPLLLYVDGNPDLLHLPALAIVGSRNPTKGGARTAFEFAHHLAGAGFTIVSGLAQGIDAAAHRGALAAGGTTIAFLGHGIDRVYPASNKELAHEIAAKGALVSEYPLGMHPGKHHFPERNRLISGLTLGTLVVEAARRTVLGYSGDGSLALLDLFLAHALPNRFVFALIATGLAVSCIAAWFAVRHSYGQRKI